MDANGDGNLSHNELKRYVAAKDEAARLKLGIGKWQDFLKSVDADGDGKVSRLEFVVYFTRVVDLEPERCFGELFDAIDVSGDGSLAYGELRDYQWYKNPRIFALLGVSDFSAMVKKMDTDGDGKVGREEFVAYMSKKVPDLDVGFKTAMEISKSSDGGSEHRGTKRTADEASLAEVSGSAGCRGQLART
jgi:Ca2+-binding EF-hand superfamily protein